MTDFAMLGLGVDSKPVVQARDELGRFTKAAGDAEKGAKGFTTATGQARDELGRFSAAGGGASSATGKLRQEVQQVQGPLMNFKSILAWIGGFVGFTSLAMTITSAIERISEAERRAARLQSVLETTGRSKYTSVAEIKAFADEMERSTGVAADEVLAAAARLATFETIVGESFQKAIKVALDFSEVYGGTLATNIEAVARALEDPINGMAMLQKQGFKLTDEQKRQVKMFVQLGDVAGWQKVIFDQVAGSTGAAERAYVGLRREVTGARLAFEKFVEAMIAALGGTTGAQAVLSGLAGTFVYLTNNMDLTLGVLAGFSTLLLLRFIPAIAAAVIAINTFTIALMRNPFGLLAVAVATAVTYLVTFRNEIISVMGVTTTGGGILNAVWTTLVNSVMTVFTWVAGVYEILRKIVTFDWSGIGDTMAETGRRMIELAKNTKQAWEDAFKPQLSSSQGFDESGFLPAAPRQPPPAPPPGITEEYRKLIAQAERRTEQMRTEVQLVGQVGAAAAAYRFEQDLLARAAEQGIIVGAKQAAHIKKLAGEYGALAEQLAKLKLQDDLMFERDQLGRSDMDARIADKLRGAGLAVDFNSYEAGLIRINEQLKISRDLAMDFAGTFVSEFRSALRNGEDFWEAFAKAGEKALNRIADKLMDMAVQDLVGKAFGGAGGLGSIFGGSGATGAASGDAWAGLRMARGGLFSHGNVVPFANGAAFSNGVVSKPTVFPFKNGVGLMGEAGDEAIMPLKRMASGKLGVETTGGKNGGGAVRVYLDDGLKAEIVAAANDGAIEIVKANNRAREKVRQAGG
jgi:hypothetical protein